MSLARFGYRMRDAWHILGQARLGEVARMLVPVRQRRLVLNEGDGDGPSGDATGDALERLARLGRTLQGEVFTDEGRVDYARLAESSTYAELARVSRMLAGARVPDGDAARTALWVNLYNVLTIHGIVALGIRRSVMEIPTFFGRVSYRVAGHELSLDEMEGLLRGNRKTPVTGRPAFTDGDPRLALAPAGADPRVHGALVCAAQSCPPIAFYDAARLDAQLDLAAANLAAAAVIDDPAHTVTVPSIFLWYDEDFGGRDGAVAFLMRHARPAARAELQRALAAGHRLRYAAHAWPLNAGPA